MLTLQVSGMTCEHCVRAIRAAVHALPAAGEVEVDLAQGEVRVAGKADPQAVRAAIEAEGYTVRP